MAKNKALFLDRDGTIIEWIDYLHDPDKVRLRPCAVELMRLALNNKYLLIVVTNQSGVGRKSFSIKEVDAVNKKMSDFLVAEGIKLTAIYVATYFEGEESLSSEQLETTVSNPTVNEKSQMPVKEFVPPHFAIQKYGISFYSDSSHFRKPQIGMLLKASQDHNIDLFSSIMIGDSDSDYKTGINARLYKSYQIDKSVDFDPLKIEI